MLVLSCYTGIRSRLSSGERVQMQLRGEIFLELEGQCVSEGVLTVRTFYGVKAQELGRSEPETLAWLMLLELVREEKGREGWSANLHRKSDRPPLLRGGLEARSTDVP